MLNTFEQMLEVVKAAQDGETIEREDSNGKWFKTTGENLNFGCGKFRVARKPRVFYIGVLGVNVSEYLTVSNSRYDAENTFVNNNKPKSIIKVVEQL